MSSLFCYLVIGVPAWALIAHFVGDFLFQSDWMAINKSKHWDVLAIHVVCYTLAFLPFYCLGWIGKEFLVWLWATHFLTDAITSRLTSRLWFLDMFYLTDKEERSWTEGYDFLGRFNGKRHWFFVMIGFDQLLHYLTIAYLINALGTR